jgi:hypothetical protein
MPAVKLLSNVPIQLALLDPPEGELDGRYEIVHYTTNAGTLTVSYRVAAKINALELRAGESFHICKREKPEGIQWDVWLASESEQGRAIEETPTELEAQLSKSLEIAPPIGSIRAVPRKPARRANPDQPRLFDKGTGTDGPAPQPRPAALPVMPPLKPARVQIPYNVAFREVTKFVTEELKATGEQWSDQARQDMISTILIAAAKSGLLSVWERGNAII